MYSIVLIMIKIYLLHISSVAVLENEGTEAEGLHRESSEHLLWVEKYSPKHYTELLSDDVSDISM